MGDNSYPTTRRRHMREFYKAMQVVKHLNVSIQNILHRYNHVRHNMHPAYVSSLHRRLTTIEGVRGLYLEYARTKMRTYPGDTREEHLSPEEDSDLEASGSEADMSDCASSVSDSIYEESDCVCDVSVCGSDVSGYEADSDEDDEFLDVPSDISQSSDKNVPGHYPSSKVISIVGSVVDDGTSGDHCEELIGRVQGQFEEIAITSDEGEITLDDLSDDEVDTFAMQDTHHSRV